MSSTSKNRKKNNKKAKKKSVKKTNKNSARKKYSRSDVNNAIFAVKEGKSLRTASSLFNVPVTSIFRAVKSNNSFETKFGPTPVLSDSVEARIVDWILHRSKTGDPVTKPELLNNVQNYVLQEKLETPFIDGKPGRHWYESFMKRHPNLSIRRAQNLTGVRANVTEENLRCWFSDVKTYLQQKKLLDIDSSRVYNCDETSMLFNPKIDKVIAQKGAPTVYKVVGGNEKENLTVLFTYGANGSRSPPMILYPYKQSIRINIIRSVPSGWSLGMTEDGWMTKESFYEYVTNVFDKWLTEQNIERPVLLYADGHSSHFTIPLVQFCRDNGIELISLFPNSTHILQPLDVALFSNLKRLWKNFLPTWKRDNNVTRLTRESFGVALSQLMSTFENEREIIISGFKACGLMPFNPDIIDYNLLDKKRKNRLNKITQENPKTSNEESNDNSADFVSQFEKTLPANILIEFENAKTIGAWTGELEYKALFEHWLKIKTGSNQASPMGIYFL